MHLHSPQANVPLPEQCELDSSYKKYIYMKCDKHSRIDFSPSSLKMVLSSWNSSYFTLLYSFGFWNPSHPSLLNFKMISIGLVMDIFCKRTREIDVYNIEDTCLASWTYSKRHSTRIDWSHCVVFCDEMLHHHRTSPQLIV